MARQARLKSETGIYHVMLRGNERKAVFLEDEDKNKFINIVFQKMEATGSHLYSYCIMDNHVHMVIQELENGQQIATLMKRIGVSYAVYYNRKYKRVGHVFQDRFRSEVVEEDVYLLSVIRYIHQNPVKAGMAPGLNYFWSSYSWYIGRKKDLPLLPEMNNILDQLSVDRNMAVKSFIKFHEKEESKVIFDVDEVSDNEDDAEVILDKFLRSHNLEKKDLNASKNRALAVKLVRILVRKTELSGRQVADLAGVNREKVRKIILSLEPSL